MTSFAQIARFFYACVCLRIYPRYRDKNVLPVEIDCIKATFCTFLLSLLLDGEEKISSGGIVLEAEKCFWNRFPIALTECIDRDGSWSARRPSVILDKSSNVCSGLRGIKRYNWVIQQARITVETEIYDYACTAAEENLERCQVRSFIPS